MMKCVFSLVVLLHLCNTITIDFNLNNEIIESLKNMSKLYKEGQINITSPERVRVPSLKMNKHAAHCVEIFKEELKTLLSNVVVVNNDSDTVDTLEMLEENLDILQQEGKTELHCNTTRPFKLLEVFDRYVHFLMKLNNSTTNKTSTTAQ